jgi:hypothetical protein
MTRTRSVPLPLQRKRLRLPPPVHRRCTHGPQRKTGQRPRRRTGFSIRRHRLRCHMDTIHLLGQAPRCPIENSPLRFHGQTERGPSGWRGTMARNPLTEPAHGPNPPEASSLARHAPAAEAADPTPAATASTESAAAAGAPTDTAAAAGPTAAATAAT